MIRPEFRKILLDQRGAAVILWSCLCYLDPDLYRHRAQRSEQSQPRQQSRFRRDRRESSSGCSPSSISATIPTGSKRNLIGRGDPARRASATKLFRALEEFKGGVEERAAFVVSTYVTRKVVIFAIIEAIAVYGFVLAFLGRFVFRSILALGFEPGALGIEFPSEKSLEALVSKRRNKRRSIAVKRNRIRKSRLQSSIAPLAALGRMAQRRLQLFQKNPPRNFLGAEADTYDPWSFANRQSETPRP